MTPPLPTVELRHDEPNGGCHIDWMLARDAAGVQPLRTFRAPQPIHELREGESIVLETLGDHRPAYLTYQGEVSGDRGSVTRIAEGTYHRVDAVQTDEGVQRMRVEWRLRPDHVIEQEIELSSQRQGPKPAVFALCRLRRERES